MDILKGIGSFIDGIRSVIDLSAIVEEKISISVARGVQEGLQQSLPSLIRAGLVITLLITGIILMGFGAGRALEAALHSPGLGYLVAGAVIAVVGACIYFQKNGNK